MIAGEKALILVVSGLVAGAISGGDASERIMESWLVRAQSIVCARLKVVAVLGPGLTEREYRILQSQCAAWPNIETHLKTPAMITQELLAVPGLAESLQAVEQWIPPGTPGVRVEGSPFPAMLLVSIRSDAPLYPVRLAELAGRVRMLNGVQGVHYDPVPGQAWNNLEALRRLLKGVRWVAWGIGGVLGLTGLMWLGRLGAFEHGGRQWLTIGVISCLGAGVGIALVIGEWRSLSLGAELLPTPWCWGWSWGLGGAAGLIVGRILSELVDF